MNDQPDPGGGTYLYPPPLWTRVVAVAVPVLALLALLAVVVVAVIGAAAQ